jgi:hypothetical protein
VVKRAEKDIGEIRVVAREEKGLEGGKRLEKERDWRRKGLQKERD